MILFLLACGTEPADTAASDSGTCETAVTWQNFAQGYFASYCQSCHASTTPDRHGAPEGVDFATEAETREQAAAVRRTVLTNSTMPPGGGLLEDDVALLTEWLDCAPAR
ncbi:MAG: hypothetical protein Q8P18_19240 [Pseudomonadota bacterium]|nr:hypothetical protein [Pseudomonadota bacterium]